LSSLIAAASAAELAKAERAAGRLVRDLAHRRRALGRGHVPALRGRRDQTFARARAGLLDHLAGLTNGTAAARRKAAIDLVLLEIAISRSVFRLVADFPNFAEMAGLAGRRRIVANRPVCRS
jgi:hypothetical protein